MHPQGASSPSQDHRRGLTVIELVISLTVLAVVLIGLGMVVSSGSKSYQTGVTSNQVQQLSQRAVDRIAEELLEAGGVYARLARIQNTTTIEEGFERLEGEGVVGAAAGGVGE